MKHSLFHIAIVAVSTVAWLAAASAEPQQTRPPSENNDKWEFSFRQCHARKSIAALEHGWADEAGNEKVAVDLDDVLQLQKLIRDLKKCTAFYKCLEDRDAGKVKHCYENDRRWK